MGANSFLLNFYFRSILTVVITTQTIKERDNIASEIQIIVELNLQHFAQRQQFDLQPADSFWHSHFQPSRE